MTSPENVIMIWPAFLYLLTWPGIKLTTSVGKCCINDVAGREMKAFNNYWPGRENGVIIDLGRIFILWCRRVFYYCRCPAKNWILRVLKLLPIAKSDPVSTPWAHFALRHLLISARVCLHIVVMLLWNSSQEVSFPHSVIEAHASHYKVWST